ncbi:FAD-binding oxidoreductase [Halorussus caseinilyticus]|uniref:FAD-binding oxidoreductase n=1 Tax=Halorussus caseinilyticus TaxID=3034025 RepID=A0ABD5WR93_9EURY|nr:FAD-binding oxidoreductase [Halorussus sp. DT72]
MTVHALSEEGVSALAADFAGELVAPGDDEYEQARRVWNGMINARPALVAYCTGAADVRAAVAFARERGVPVTVRGGGHGVAGNAVVDGGLVVDLSAMDDVRVDPDERRVRVGGGAQWADVDRETQQFGLAVPGGVVSDTGVAGLTLGGGLGHLRRAYGASCDSLRSADVVTADGDLVVASAERNADLFWALRGGGGNFGVVTSFEFDCHPVGPEVETAFVWYRGDEAREVFAAFREYAADAPREVSALPFYAWVPDEADFPESSWGDPTVVVLGCYAGDPEEGEDALRPVRELADPLADFSGRMAYAELQTMLDADYPHGRYYYWKSVYLDELTDDVLDRVLGHAETCPSKLTTIDFWQLGGAIAEVGEDETAFPNRDAAYLLNYEANWDDPRETETNVRWARECVEDVRELDAVRGQYVNFPGMGEDAAEVAYGESYGRLADVKETYDPENVFRGHQNVGPR